MNNTYEIKRTIPIVKTYCFSRQKERVSYPVASFRKLQDTRHLFVPFFIPKERKDRSLLSRLHDLWRIAIIVRNTKTVYIYRSSTRNKTTLTFRAFLHRPITSFHLGGWRRSRCTAFFSNPKSKVHHVRSSAIDASDGIPHISLFFFSYSHTHSYL